MSEREPYDEELLDCALEWPKHIYAEGVRKVAKMARSEHIARLEAEARVERLEGAILLSMDNHFSTSFREGALRVALETGGE